MCPAPQARDCGCMSALREDEQASQADGSTHAARTGSPSEASVQVRALAADLRTRGFAASTGPGEDPLSITAENRTSPLLSATVHAAPSQDCSWWFWWSRGEPISRISEVETAAFKIAYVLTVQPDDSHHRRHTAHGTGNQPALRAESGHPRADQVVRRHRFEAAHPDVTITFTREGWTWTCTCVADGREEVVTGHELRHLLDKLEAIIGAESAQ